MNPFAWVRDWVRPEHGWSQYGIYLVGCVLFSIGANCFIASELGTDPLDVLALGLRDHLGITVGMAQAGVAALFLGIWSIWNRRAPLLSPFVTFALCGTLIDLWMLVRLADHVPIGPYPLMSAGVLICSCGSALIVMSGIGIRSMDLLAITALRRLGVPFWLGKGVLEIALLGSGWALGGPVGVGTVAFLACVGWLIQPLMWLNALMGIPNYGLAPPDASEVSSVETPSLGVH